MTLHSGEIIRLRKAVGERAYQLCESDAQRPEFFQKIYSALKGRYNVSSYKEIKQHHLQDALRFLAEWDGRA